MSLRALEPWERRLWVEMRNQGKSAARNSASEWCSLSPLQLRKEIERLNTNFRTNWKQIAYLEGHLQAANERFSDRRDFGVSLRGQLEAVKTKSLEDWF
ncbi:MAG: hypothetical protein ABSG92_00130 [Conexivisphaerales archaeon]